MNKQTLLLSFFVLTVTAIKPVCAQEMSALNKDGHESEKAMNWILSNVSTQTGMPLSFGIDKKDKERVIKKIGESDSVTGIIERMIVEEGVSIYDASLWQIALALRSDPQLLERAMLPTNIYWEGRLGGLNNIRAGGFPKQSFIYDANNQSLVSSELSNRGERGFIFRILSANGNYLIRDSLDGKQFFEGYPNWSRIHWEDWKPIAGENAWVVIAALHLYHKKYFDENEGKYDHADQAKELLLAKELARAAMILQAENGGVRMAPLGTYHYSIEKPEEMSLKEFTRLFDEQGDIEQLAYQRTVDSIGHEAAVLSSHQNAWYYHEQSTENNLSWYTAFRSLYEITRDPQYSNAMLKIENYLKTVWNEEENYFYQGVHFVEGEWIPNKKHFATDVQTWGISKLGPEKIDSWFGEGAAYRMWLTTKEKSGEFSKDTVHGVGYTSENDRVSIEWTMGAIYAMRELAHHYKYTHQDWAKDAFNDARVMRETLEGYKVSLDQDSVAYPYSTKRDWVPFGWFSHDTDVLSLVSTCWVYIYDRQFNPFYIGSERDFIFEDIQFNDLLVKKK